MDNNFSFHKTESSSGEDEENPTYFSDRVIEFAENLKLEKSGPTIVLFGQPVENRNVFIMEKRPGCDLAANIIQRGLKRSRYAFPENSSNLNIISFLGYYESHPLKMNDKDFAVFYQQHIFLEIQKAVKLLCADLQSTIYIDFAGTIDYLFISVLNHSKNYDPSTCCLIKMSPLVYENTFSEYTSKIYHLGLDKKFDNKYKDHIQPTANSLFSFYDIGKGINEELKILEELFSKYDNVQIIFDCQVFSSEYFQGVPVPFPFSYSKNEIYKIIALIASNRNKVKFLGVCHFNPTVEERRSSIFLIDFLYKFISQNF